MIDLFHYGYIPVPDVQEDETCIAARITAVHKERYELVCKYGVTHGRLKSAVYFSGKEYVEFPTTGDFVLIRYIADGDSQILRTLERKSFFSRKDPTPGRGEQAVAANFDYVFILTSLNQDFNLKRLERYLTLAWQSGSQPVIVLTKADLATNLEIQMYMKQVGEVAIGVGTYAVSVKTGIGLTELRELLQPRKTIVLLGSSGVGKSSLLNALTGQDIMEIRDIREDDSKGRHTTTHRQLIMLENGAMIIDTPGMRELGMWDVREGIGEAFSDVNQYLADCRFSNCTHGNEPGCAVRMAIERGELSPERWESYLQLKREAKYSDDKAGYLKEKQQWGKSIAKYSRQIKKNRKQFD